VQRFRGGLVFKALGLCASLNSRLESNKEEEEEEDPRKIQPKEVPRRHWRKLKMRKPISLFRSTNLASFGVKAISQC